MTQPTRRVGGLAVYEHGGAPDAARVVFVHGSMDRAASFLKVQRRLTDLTCIRYDRRGYGRSLDTGPADSLDQQIDDLGAVVGTGRAVVVGHSLGGVLALAFAQRHADRVAALVAFEAPMPWEPWWPTDSAGNQALAARDNGDAATSAERFMRVILGDERWERLPPSTRKHRLAEGPALLAELALLRTGVAAYDSARVRVPVLVGRGSASATPHRRSAEELAARLEDGDLLEIAGATHVAHTTHPDEFAGIVRKAVARA